jgi:hypothetical protein
MVLQNYQNLIKMTLNIFIIIAFGVGFKCPCKIHLNTWDYIIRWKPKKNLKIQIKVKNSCTRFRICIDSKCLTLKINTYWRNKHQNHQHMTQWQHHLCHYILLLCNRFHSLLFPYYRHRSEIWYLVSLKWSKRAATNSILT